MLQTFFTNTIESKFIKQLLYSTPLPTLQTRRCGDRVLFGKKYIFGENVVVCTKSGILGEDAIPNNLAPIKHFDFGNFYPQLTERYISKYNYYDSRTHYQLGMFLRSVRDLRNVDLMPYYNCFNYQSLYGFHISSNKDMVFENRKGIKLLAVPIKFDKTYTVSFECATKIYMFPVVYRNGALGFIDYYTYDNQSYDIENKRGYKKLVKVVERSRFVAPFTYKLSLDEFCENVGDEDIYKIDDLEKNLYLVIQVPESNSSSILVQEGDYTNAPRLFLSNGSFRYTEQIVNLEDVDSYTQQDIDSALCSPLSLGKIGTTETYAFSNRLIEYLLLNVIDINDKIGENIEREQEILFRNPKKYTKGVWNNALRFKTFFESTKQISRSKGLGSLFLDLNGFIDRDAENIINGIKVSKNG